MTISWLSVTLVITLSLSIPNEVSGTQCAYLKLLGCFSNVNVKEISRHGILQHESYTLLKCRCALRARNNGFKYFVQTKDGNDIVCNGVVDITNAVKEQCFQTCHQHFGCFENEMIYELEKNHITISTDKPTQKKTGKITTDAALVFPTLIFPEA